GRPKRGQQVIGIQIGDALCFHTTKSTPFSPLSRKVSKLLKWAYRAYQGGVLSYFERSTRFGSAGCSSMWRHNSSQASRNPIENALIPSRYEDSAGSEV